MNELRAVPAGAFRKDDEMRMVHGPFDKFDARKVLPVTHGLFEERFVRAGKVGVDLVRNHSVVPDALFARRRGAPRPDGDASARRLRLRRASVFSLGFRVRISRTIPAAGWPYGSFRLPFLVSSVQTGKLRFQLFIRVRFQPANPADLMHINSVYHFSFH